MQTGIKSVRLHPLTPVCAGVYKEESVMQGFPLVSPTQTNPYIRHSLLFLNRLWEQSAGQRS